VLDGLRVTRAAGALVLEMADLQARVTELEAKLLASTTNEKALQARVAELEAMLLAAT